MATIMGIEMLIISHRQSFTKYAIAANTTFHIVQDKLSHTPTNFLCSTSTHSTAVETQTHYPPCTFLYTFFKEQYSVHVCARYSGLWRRWRCHWWKTLWRISALRTSCRWLRKRWQWRRASQTRTTPAAWSFGRTWGEAERFKKWQVKQLTIKAEEKVSNLSLRLPKAMAPNITPTKKIVAVALFFPLLSHTRSHF